MTFDKELEQLINRYSMERYSNTPDYILAQYMYACLIAYNDAVRLRDQWWGKQAKPAFPPSEDPPSLR